MPLRVGFLTRGDCATVALGPCILKREREIKKDLFCIALDLFLGLLPRRNLIIARLQLTRETREVTKWKGIIMRIINFTFFLTPYHNDYVLYFVHCLYSMCHVLRVLFFYCLYCVLLEYGQSIYTVLISLKLPKFHGSYGMMMLLNFSCASLFMCPFVVWFWLIIRIEHYSRIHDLKENF